MTERSTHICNVHVHEGMHSRTLVVWSDGILCIGKTTEWQEEKGGLQGRRSEGGIWGRQDCSQHSVACTSANERGKGSSSNYTEIMAIPRNHGNSSHPARLPPPLPHPLAALSSYFTPLKWILFKKKKKIHTEENQCRAFCQLMTAQVFASVPIQLGDMHKTLVPQPTPESTLSIIFSSHCECKRIAKLQAD